VNSEKKLNKDLIKTQQWANIFLWCIM